MNQNRARWIRKNLDRLAGEPVPEERRHAVARKFRRAWSKMPRRSQARLARLIDLLRLTREYEEAKHAAAL